MDGSEPRRTASLATPPFSAALADFGEELGPTLAPLALLEPLRTLADTLDLGHAGYCLETHCDDVVRRVDLVVRVAQIDRADLAPIRGTLPAPGLDALCGAWTRSDGALSWVPYVELEFDGTDPDAGPWVGPAVDPRLDRGPGGAGTWSPTRIRRAPGSRAVARAILGSLAGYGPDHGVMRRVERCFDALPPSGGIGHLALFEGRPGRHGSGARIILRIPMYAIHDYLATVGWSGDVESMLAWHGVDGALLDHISFDLDVRADGLGTRTAVYREFHVPRRSNSQLSRLVSTLRDRGLLAPQISEALLRWVTRVSGRRDRVLTIKTVLPARRAPHVKLYYSDLGRQRTADKDRPTC